MQNAVEAAVSAAFVDPAGDTPATTVPSSFVLRASAFCRRPLVHTDGQLRLSFRAIPII
jgi:hypothetical protein